MNIEWYTTKSAKKYLILYWEIISLHISQIFGSLNNIRLGTGLRLSLKWLLNCTPAGLRHPLLRRGEHHRTAGRAMRVHHRTHRWVGMKFMRYIWWLGCFGSIPFDSFEHLILLIPWTDSWTDSSSFRLMKAKVEHRSCWWQETLIWILERPNCPKSSVSIYKYEY